MLIHGAELYSFIVVILLMIISPGANQVLVLQSGLVLGHKAALYNVIGVASSMFIHALLAGLGISLLVMQSPALYGFIKLLGTAYLGYLALSSIWGAVLSRSPDDNSTPPATEKPSRTETSIQSFSKGFSTNILNVHTSFIFLSIYPQYMNFEHDLLLQSLFLTLVFVGLLFSWYGLFITLIAKIRDHLIRPGIQLKIKAVTGVLLLVMTIKMFWK